MVPFVLQDPMCPLFIELLIQRGRKSSTNPTAGPALAMPRWGSQGNSGFPESQDSVGCLKVEYLFGNNFLLAK